MSSHIPTETIVDFFTFDDGYILTLTKLVGGVAGKRGIWNVSVSAFFVGDNCPTSEYVADFDRKRDALVAFRKQQIRRTFNAATKLSRVAPPINDGAPAYDMAQIDADFERVYGAAMRAAGL